MSAIADWLGDLFGLEWARPIALLALIPAVSVLLAGLIRERPVSRPLGTTPLWQELLKERSEAVAASRLRRRYPWFLWILSLALICTALAMAGPTRKENPLQQRFTVYADDGPSMELSWNGGQQTRRELARASFEEWRSTLDEIEVVFEFSEGLPENGGRAGDIILTDDARPWLDTPVGLFASGGEAVPGAIGLGSGESGESVVYRMGPEGEILIVAAAEKPAVTWGGVLPRAVREVFLAWGAERGFEVLRAQSSEQKEKLGSLLDLRGPIESSIEESVGSAEGGVDRWFARGPVSPLQAGTPLSFAWVTAPNGEALVRSELGQIRTAWSSFDSRTGSNEDFALSWARLFDRTLLTPDGIVSAKDRRAAGEGYQRVPDWADAPRTRAKEGRKPLPLDLFWGAAALTLACLAAWMRARGVRY